MAGRVSADSSLRIFIPPPPLPQEEGDSSSIDFSTPSHSDAGEADPRTPSHPSIETTSPLASASTSSTVNPPNNPFPISHSALRPSSPRSTPGHSGSTHLQPPSAPPLQRSHSDSEIPLRTPREGIDFEQPHPGKSSSSIDNRSSTPLPSS